MYAYVGHDNAAIGQFFTMPGWLAWGNGDCYLVKLKPNMIDLDGHIQKLDPANYAEGPWLYKRNGIPGGDVRRSVAVEYMDFSPDGSILPITQTSEGVSLPHK